MAKRKKKAFVYLFDGFSDWEIAFLSPEIKKSEQWEIIYFSQSGEMITSDGGLQIRPTASLEKLTIDMIDLLVLPGGDAWENGANRDIEKITLALVESRRPIAAICAATTFLGQLGLLNGISHTSNDIHYLKAIAPDYTGDKNYKNNLAVTDGNIITANGVAPIEFSKHIFELVELHDEHKIEKWFQLFKNGIWDE